MKRGSAETRLLDKRSPASPGSKEADTPGCGDNPVPAFTNEGTQGIWLPEEHALKLTKLEVGWLYGVLDVLDRQNGENWPTAKPGPNGEAIPTTMPRRICDKLAEFWK